MECAVKLSGEKLHGEEATEMMGFQPPPQDNLFNYGVNLNKRVRQNHPLRRIESILDLEFTYGRVRDRYGLNGNVSIPPPVIVKLMLLLVLYNVRSERELMATLPERLDWLWFLGYTLDSEIPDHSVLSKARRRWGVEVFKELFERVVFQCVEAGLVDGSKIFVDASLIEADASNNSVVDTQSLKKYLKKSYLELERRLEEDQETVDEERSYRKANNRYISTTDPDATIVRRGKAKLRYQIHRAVDPAVEVITATEVTTGDVNEAHRMVSLIDTHQDNTGRKAETVVADSKYATIDNYISCYDRGLRAHIPDLKNKQEGKGSRRGIFSEARFQYERETDTYICPAGKKLKPKTLHKGRQSRDYGASKKDCERCTLRSQCTRNKSGRTVKRHLRQDELDEMRARARWRRLWRVQIQEYITAAIQNIQVLIRNGKDPTNKAAIAMPCVKMQRKLTTLSAHFMQLVPPSILRIEKYVLSNCTTQI
jgi:transposase